MISEDIDKSRQIDSINVIAFKILAGLI